MAFRSAGVLALVLAAGAATAAAQSAQSAQAQRRFSGMDANRDGVITRDEWRGSDQSFRVHDWNGDGVLSGDEVRAGARRPAPQVPADPTLPVEYDDWTDEGFARLDANRDGRITLTEWRFDRDTFRRADHNGDGWISRREFLGGDESIDDERADRFTRLDANNDGRLTRAEWNGTAERFAVLDDNRDGFLTRAEMLGANEPPPDLFASVDRNRDRVITRDEWRWSRASFDQRDADGDGRLTPQEFDGRAPDAQSSTYRAGFDRGLVEGRQAGREDRELRNAWDLEGQRELEGADSGYEPRLGPKAEYQAGYRAGFRRGYKEGFGR